MWIVGENPEMTGFRSGWRRREGGGKPAQRGPEPRATCLNDTQVAVLTARKNQGKSPHQRPELGGK
jgi:hypothetical protein